MKNDRCMPMNTGQSHNESTWFRVFFACSGLLRDYTIQLLLAGMLTASFSVWAQAPYYVHYGTKEGLISEEVYNLKQDQEGYVWIASDRGLTKFNGQTFRHFSAKDGLPHNLITELFVDQQKRVWCIVHRSGLVYIENDSVHTPHWLDKLAPHFEHINSFCQLADGRYLMGFLWHHPEADVPAFALISENDNTVEWIHEPNGTMASMFVNGEDVGYTLQNDKDYVSGKVEWVGESASAVNTASAPSTFDELFSDAIGRAEDSLFVVSTQKQLFVNTPSEQKAILLDHRISNSLFLDRAQNLWVGLFKGGVYCYPNADISLPPTKYLEQYSVTSVMQDEEGGYWFSTIEMGVFYMPFPDLEVYTSVNGLPENRITKAHLAGDTLWMIYRNGAVTASPISAERIGFEVVVQRDYVGSSFIDSKGSLNISVPKPQVENKAVKEWKYYTSLYEDSSGIIYAGTTIGEVIKGKNIDAAQPLFDPLLDLPRTNHIVKTNDGSLWLGTTAGPYQLLEGQLSFLPDRFQEMKGYVTCLESFEDILFVGIGGKGLFALKSNQIQQLHSGKGLSSDFVHALIVDTNDSVWLATASGIDCFPLNLLFDPALTIRHLGILNALPSSCVNDLLMIDGKLWAFTDGGLAIISREAVLRNDASDKLNLTSLKVNGISRDLHGPRAFTHRENNVQIGFQSMSYRSPRSRTYAYRLAGMDSNWSFTRASAVNLSGLQPGSYALEVRNGNNLASYRAEPLRFSFTIEPPLWQRIYVWLPAFLLLVAGLSALVIWRIRALKRSAHLQQQVSNLSLRALQVQMNPHFVYNCLNGIQNLIVKNDQNASLDYLGKFSRLVRSVFNHSARNLVPLSEELTNLQLYTELEQGRYPGRIELSMDVDDALLYLFVPPMLLQPFVENAILHGILPSTTDGHILISIHAHKSQLQVEVKDNGIGINKGRSIKMRKDRFLAPPSRAGAQPQSGLHVTKSRIHSFLEKHGMNARVQILDRSTINSSESGTIVSFILPILPHD